MDEDSKKHIVRTGTTILGIVCKDGVIIAGDRRVTLGGHLISSKDYQKVVRLNDYLLFAGCGSATEAQKVSKILTAELKLKELRSKSKPTVKQSASLLSNIQVSESAFILAGIDNTGASLYEITGGFLNEIKDYTASVGSGMPYVLGLFERQWKPNLTIEQGVELAKEAIKSSTQRDVGSGNGMDIYTITKEGIKKVVDMTIDPSYNEH